MESTSVAIRGVSLGFDRSMEWIKVKNIGKGSYALVDLAKIVNPPPHAPDVPSMLAVKYSPYFPTPLTGKEYRVLQRFLGCPYINQCHGEMLSLEDEVVYYNLLLSYAPGGTLLHLIHRYGGNIPESHVRCYTKMILQGLCHIHEKGYVHSDLKPANILVYPPQPQHQYGSLCTLKIADFGVAKEPDEEAADGVSLGFRGTPHYMSPEAVEHGEITASLDIWSLGCIVVEMMTGKLPWDGIDNLKDLANKIAFTCDMPYIPEDMSKVGKDFLLKCFARDPHERWTANRLMNHPFLAPNTLWAPQTSFLRDNVQHS